MSENTIILLRRFATDGNATLSTIAVDGEFVCFGVEDGPSPAGDVKVPGQTRIPAGSYPVTCRTTGGFHSRYAGRYGPRHKGMLWVREIPDFEFVLIHIGNTKDDTEGCILPNTGVIADPSGYFGTRSGPAYFRLYNAVIEQAIAGELTLSVVDEGVT